MFCGTDFKTIDEKRGQLLMEAASAAGLPLAEAYCHLEGWCGFAKDEQKGFEMFKKIAEETGDAISEYLVGLCFDNGYGVAQNKTKAVEWFTKAAEKGINAAMYNLGYCFENGDGVARNLATALEWYTKARDAGDEDAQERIDIVRGQL